MSPAGCPWNTGWSFTDETSGVDPCDVRPGDPSLIDLRRATRGAIAVD